MLPDKYHDSDKEFILAQMDKLSPQLRYRAASGYTAVYQEAYDSEPAEHRRTNKARREANIRLRTFVDRYARSAMGYTSAPPALPR